MRWGKDRATPAAFTRSSTDSKRWTHAATGAGAEPDSGWRVVPAQADSSMTTEQACMRGRQRHSSEAMPSRAGQVAGTVPRKVNVSSIVPFYLPVIFSILTLWALQVLRKVRIDPIFAEQALRESQWPAAGPICDFGPSRTQTDNHHFAGLNTSMHGCPSAFIATLSVKRLVAETA